MVRLDSSDVVRHRLVGQIVDAWAQHDERREREREAARTAAGGVETRAAVDGPVSVEVANESGVPVDEPRLVACARHVLDAMSVNPLVELSVLLVDLDHMSRLCTPSTPGRTAPTDVLAFEQDDVAAGDVAGLRARGGGRAAAAGRRRAVPAGGRRAGTHGRARHGRGAGPVCSPTACCTCCATTTPTPDGEREMFGLQARLLAVVVRGRGPMSARATGDGDRDRPRGRPAAGVGAGWCCWPGCWPCWRPPTPACPARRSRTWCARRAPRGRGAGPGHGGPGALPQRAAAPAHGRGGPGDRAGDGGGAVAVRVGAGGPRGRRAGHGGGHLRAGGGRPAHGGCAAGHAGGAPRRAHDGRPHPPARPGPRAC